MPEIPDPRYLTCTVTVHDERKLTFDGFSNLSEVPLGGDGLTLESIERLSYWVEDGQHCSRDDLELLGKLLHRYMFGDANSHVYQGFHTMLASLKKKEYQDWRLRLTLAFEPKASRLSQLPWEFLYVEEDGGYFFSAPSKATQLVLTRILPPPPELIDSLEPEEGPLRILVALCSPTADGLVEVKAEKLVPQLLGLRSLGVDVKVLPNPRYAEIEQAIQPAGLPPWRPHIFHFIGHGDVKDAGGVVAIKFSEEEEQRQFGKTGNRTPDVAWIPTAKLIDLFPGDQLPRLIFLHACRGAKEGESSYQSLASGAEQFVRAGAPAAIAMRYDIELPAADQFASHFYQRLSMGSPVDDAVTAARIELAKKYSWGDRQFGTPLLFLQSKQAILLRPTVEQHEDRSVPGPEPQEDDDLFDCPYRFDRKRRCTRLVERGMDVCPKCQGTLLWCTHGHPCMADDRECAICHAILSPAAPTRPLKLVKDEGVSGFAG